MLHDMLAFVIQKFVILYPAFLAVFTFRGFFRALVAKKMGDETAYHEGYMTLNPIMHSDVFALAFLLFIALLISALLDGTVQPFLIYNVLIFMGIRWGSGLTIEPRNFKRLKLGMVLMLLAGPCSLLLLSLLFLYIAKYVPYAMMPPHVSVSLLSIFNAIINLSLWFGVFHLLPIPPLDGGRLLQFLLPYSHQKALSWIETYSFFILMVLFFLPPISYIFHGIMGLITLIVHLGLSALVF